MSKKFFCLILFLFMPTCVWSHAIPQLKVPAADATVSAPQLISIEFNAALEPNFSNFYVEDKLKQKIGTGEVDPENIKRLILTNPNLPSGTYQVYWTAVSRDGHRTQGNYSFKVK